MYVYILEGDGRIKIGYSDCPANRLNGIQVHTTDELKLAYVSKPLEKFKLVERVSHKLLKSKKTKGEWFKVSLAEGKEAVLKAIEIVSTGQEGWYLARTEYKYPRLTISLLGQVTTDLEQLRSIWEKKSGKRLSFAEVVKRMTAKALANDEFFDQLTKS